jgi:hypothetical protein
VARAEIAHRGPGYLSQLLAQDFLDDVGELVTPILDAAGNLNVVAAGQTAGGGRDRPSARPPSQRPNRLLTANAPGR